MNQKIIDQIRIIWKLITTKVANKLILSGLTIICLTFAIRQCSVPKIPSQYETAMVQWNAKKTELLAKNDSLSRRVSILKDSVKASDKTAIHLGEEITSLKNTVGKLRKNNDVVLSSLKTTLPDTCKEALALAESYRSEADTLSVALSKADQRDSIRVDEISKLHIGISLLEVQRDSMRKVILTVPVAKPDKFLGFIPLPSRKTSLVVGLATGVVATVVTTSLVH